MLLFDIELSLPELFIRGRRTIRSCRRRRNFSRNLLDGAGVGVAQGAREEQRKRSRIEIQYRDLRQVIENDRTR